jgi:hypothetical protein
LTRRFLNRSGIEMPGYSRLFLQNRMPAQKRDAPGDIFPPNFFWTNIFAGSKVKTITTDARRGAPSNICQTTDTMRTLLIVFSLFIAPCVGRCVEPQGDNTLRFFVVSDEPVAGGRYVDTPECPKVGGITNTPNLVITRLQSVSTNASHIIRYTP